LRRLDGRVQALRLAQPRGGAHITADKNGAKNKDKPDVTKLPILIVLLACLLGGFAAGPARAAEGAAAPFDGELERLSEILGSLHYLRAVCGANEGQKWRNEMQALIDAEIPSGERRRRIVASFNRGYHVFQQTYRTCTPAADLAIRRYLDEGAKIARDITARYAN
jgi:uncharacterized protein (TIGR02301 family)